MNRSLGTTFCVGVACALVAAGGIAGCAPQPAPPTTPPAPSARLQQKPDAPALTDRPAAAQQASPATQRAIAASAAAAPASPAPSPDADSDVIARVGTKAITKDQLLNPMIQAHGLSFLLHVVQVELARQAAAQQGINVTPADVKQERELTFARMFKESDDQLREKIADAREKGDAALLQKLEAQLNVDKEQLLDQYLVQQYAQSQQYVSRPEFDLVLETNACLRKIAEASKELKNGLTDEVLQKAFAARYGEKIVVRHIQADNPGKLQDARNRINAGENFADVAKAVSMNKNTAPLGGAVPPFTINASNVPQAFKDAAFAMKDGQVSDIVEADNAYHLIKVDSRIAPKLVKFPDVKESIRADLYDQVLQAAVKQLRDKLSQQVLRNLQIDHPLLRAQFQKRLEEGKATQKAQIDDAMKRSRPDAAPAEGATAPATAAPAVPEVAPAKPAVTNTPAPATAPASELNK